MKRTLLYLILYACFAVQVLAQGMTFKNESLATVLATIRDAQSEYNIHFIHNDLEHLQVSAHIKGKTVPEAIKRVCKGQPVKVKTKGNQIFVQYRSQKDFTGKTIHLLGAVEDGFLEMPLPHAKVSVLRTDSSVVVDSSQIVVFYGSGMKMVRAQFGADVNAAEREYLVRASMDGYDDVWQRVQIPRPLQDEVEVPTLKMRRSTAKTLHEVTITATKIKMFYRGDTIVYDASAFRLPDGSMLDDLIRQLPGVTMNGDGEIFVNGRKVDELLLGSRSFFGGNKRVLMENLPYYTVKNLKVYEKQTDKSVALGYDVEPRHYVMDVILKDEYSQGYIGNVEVAGGTEHRWLGRGFLLGFTDRLRFTLLGNVNNVNEGRHLGQSDQWSPARQPRSLTTTRSVAAELNYHTKGDKLKETFRAEYTSSTDEQTMQQHNEHFIEGCSSTSVTESFNRSGNHKLKLNNTLTLTKPFYLYATADFSHARRDGSFNSAFDEWSDNLTVSQRTVSMSEGRVLDVNLSAQGAVNLSSNKKQHLDFYFNLNHQNDEMEKGSRYETRNSATSLLHNSDSLFNRSTWFLSNLGYSKEVGRDIHLGVSDNFFIRNQHNRDYLYHPDTLLLPSQIDALTAITDPHNSYDSRDRDWYNNINIGLSKRAYYMHPVAHMKVDYDRWALGIGTPLTHERLHYQRGALDTLATQTVFLPNVSFRFRNVWKGARHRDLQFNLSNKSDRTLLTDRITFRDDSQPLIVKLGNPDLKSTMHTTFSLRYYDQTARYYDQTAPNQGYYHLSASFDYHHRDVAQSLTYDPATGIRTYKPMNISGAYVARADFGTDRNIGEKRYWSWHVDAGADWNHSKDHAMMEGETESHENVVNTLTLNSGAHIRFNRKTLNVRAVGNINWRHSEGRMHDFSTLNALDFQYGIEAQYTTPPLWGRLGGGMTLAADATMYSRRGYGSALMNTNDFVLNASLSQPFFKGKLIARIEAFDLLHQLSPTQYTVNAQGRTETWYRSLPHYVMAHLVYHFNKNPKKK